ncbi:MAG: triphosphoribosyl-dephospho-CoA synthase [Methylovulum sp.]|jgi:triphosphoribosyl-dephospho-CoA synthase|nr:triphosphoribosyl-dephospho-CoA synthase [Methylovulum sp.]MCF7998670.1 triphosphoribosyl-dephospho-CoA synthase [Methylovulum sp.]
MIDVGVLMQAYQDACELELQAFKPGNVSVFAEGHDMTVADFRRSATVSAKPLCHLEYSLGEKIFYAVQATREAVGCNTNLGIILLCAPLFEAVTAVHYSELGLRAALQHVLAATTMSDAEWVFKAISLAAPGGLGASDQQDVQDKPDVTLTEAMAIAASKDRIALQYVSAYGDIFDFCVPLYYNSADKWADRSWAALAVYAALLSQFPDSHIERKYGTRYNDTVANKMTLLAHALSTADNPKLLLPLLYQLDSEFKTLHLNPGTSADMVVATVFTVFLEDLHKSSNKFVQQNK